MSKVICDICGTTYQDTADQCPICGCSRELSGMIMEDAIRSGKPEKTSASASSKGGRFAAKKAPKRTPLRIEYEDDDEEQDEDEIDKPGYEDEEEYQDDFVGDDDDYDDDDYDDEEEDTDSGDSGVAKGFLIVFLILVIAAMLLVSGFLFFRYFLPNRLPDPEQTVSTTEPSSAPTESTTVPTVPCQSLALTGGAPNLSFEGQNWLLNVVVVPEDTTDTLSYASADESVVTVTEQGRVTAVGEGETVIYITCGGVTMECGVTVSYVEDAETNTDETVEDPSASEETEPEETLLDLELWCNYKDMTLSYRGETVILKVNAELTLEDLEWTSENPDVATVENGVIKGVGHGNTNIIGRYGEQEVVIIVRCAFW